ncbi:hypothetical protein V6N11_043646 [Hibiscus sabdariffa]|uniref:Protein kinase domain-containing protein n=1 Tax=Hibiscus sabdariffa TaxID=183260 RepID=A0ABR2RDL4_9ROSI
MFTFFPLFVPSCLVKLVDWGEEGHRSAAEIASIRAAFTQEVAVWHKLDHPNVTKVMFLILYRSLFGEVFQLSDYDVEKSVRGDNGLIGLEHTENGHIVMPTDFGVARLKASNPNDMTGETGTLGYMAPEVLNGNPYNRKCNVYSFGICLWEIYCCDMPYPDLSFSVVRQVNESIADDVLESRAGDTSMLSEFTCECNEVMLGCQPRQTTGDGRSGVNVGGH